MFKIFFLKFLLRAMHSTDLLDFTLLYFPRLINAPTTDALISLEKSRKVNQIRGIDGA